MYDRNKLYSVSDLRERGWTDTAIKRFLLVPDDTRPNPRYSQKGAPMKFWLKLRVHRTEKTKRFLAWKAGVPDRKAAAERAVATRISTMENEMETVEITIRRGLTDKQICDLAAGTHGGNYEGETGEFRWSNRTARNCIRHNLTNYEHLWKRFNRGETGRSAYEILRKRVDALIDQVYPQFSDDGTK